MKKAILLATGLSLLAMSACHKTPPPRPAVAAAPAPDPKAFMTELYSHYGVADHSFTPLNDNAPRYFDADMLSLMKTDAQLNEGEVGALDGDPICDCQDYGKLKADINVVQQDATHATARVTVTETDPGFDPSDRTPRAFVYELVLVNGAWRIHDISDPTTPSLRALFVASNAQASSESAST